MKAKVEVDQANGKFRIKLDTPTQTEYSPWTSPKKMAWIQFGLYVFIASMRTRPYEKGENISTLLVAGKVYRVSAIEEVPSV